MITVAVNQALYATNELRLHMGRALIMESLKPNCLRLSHTFFGIQAFQLELTQPG